LSAEDRKLLAARLSPSEWEAVTRALRIVDLLDVERRNGFAWHGPRGLSDDMDAVIFVSDATAAAVRTLAPTAGLPLRGTPLEKELSSEPEQVRESRSAAGHSCSGRCDSSKGRR
jgi:hypothetical protein